MTRPLSPQRALIALRSFPSVAAACRSIGCKPDRLLRMTLADPELATAYDECLHGLVAARQREEIEAAKRAAPPPPRITVRAAEKSKARFFAAIGRDPRLAAGALHARLNKEERETKRAIIEAAIAAVDSMAATSSLTKPVPSVKEVWDRWCAKCQDWRIDDPCEQCGRHTREMR
jgi:hypothetical protein